MSETVTIERVLNAPLDVVWPLCTTAEGVASWYGPKGFSVEVHALDAKVGGAFSYTMTAHAQMVAMMESRGMPSVRRVDARVSVFAPQTAFAWESPWGDETLTESLAFEPVEGGVRLTVTLAATMAGMTKGAAMGWKSTLDKLAERLVAR